LGLPKQEDNPAGEREFGRLNRRAQIGRFRELAEVALHAYDLPPARLTLLAHLYNTTFRVDMSTGQRYTLHIHRSGTPTVESVGAEMAWLAALRRDTRLEVPAPVPTRAGALLTVAATPGVTRPHIVVLFRWMPGRLLRRGLTPHHMEQVGELMAHLQNHALRWAPSMLYTPSMARGRVDWPIDVARSLLDPFAPEIVASIRALVADSLSLAEAEQVAMALERVRAAEHALLAEQTAAAPNYGLIHADLHYGNLLFGNGTVRAIDFDDCGYGPLLFDHAVMLSAILEWERYPALRAALLAGYRCVRPLSAQHETYIDTFIALRRMQDVLWMLEPGISHPAIGEDWAAQARWSLAALPALLG
jgi:Ser/Thr protein kinase RdoA (MazF antagonist)